MARFFQTTDNSGKDEQKATKYFEEEEEKNEVLSKKEKKKKDIEKKISVLLEENNTKTFDKNFRKFMTELKKTCENTNSVKNAKGLTDLFAKVTNKQNLKLIENFKATFEEDKDDESSTEMIVKKTVKTKTLSLDDVLALDDEEKKIEELEKHLDNLDALMPLYFMLAKKQNYAKMMDILVKLNGFDTEKANFIKKNVPKYIESLAQEENIDYNNLLNLCKLYCIEKVADYIKVFKMNVLGGINCDLFKPVVLMKSGQVEKGKECIDLSLYSDVKNSIEQKVFEFLAVELFKTNCIQKAYEIFILFDNDRFMLEKQACCILLCDFSRDFFKKQFLEEFKRFDTNAFLLESEQKQMELCRAFYYLNIGCTELSKNIIYSIFEINSQK